MFAPKAPWFKRSALRARLHDRYDVGNLATEYPIRWVEEVDAVGNLVDGPGLGSRAVWFNHDCSFASATELTSVDPYFAHEDSTLALRRALAEVMLQVGFGEQLQMLWFPWDNAHDLLSRFDRPRLGDSPFKQWWHRTRAEREYRRMESGDLRRFRSVLALNAVPDPSSRLLNPYGITPGFGEFFGLLTKLVEIGSILKQNHDGVAQKQYAAMASMMARRLKSMEMILQQGGIYQTSPWRAQDLFDLLRKLWNPEQWALDQLSRGGKHTLPRPDALWAPFAAYFLPSSYHLLDEGHAFRFGPYWHRVLVMNTLPVFSDVGHVSAALTVPETVRGIKNMMVVVTARGVSKATEVDKLRTRIRHLTGQMQGNNEHKDNLVQIAEIEARINELRKATRPSMFNTHLHVHLWEKDLELLQEREQQVKGALASYLEMSVEGEDRETLPFVLGFEQPGYTRYPDESRFISLIPAEVAAIAPISAYNDGCVRTDKSADVPMVFETDTAVPYGLDLWPGEDRVTSLGGVGVGTSGTGKSNFYQQTILAYANRKTDIIVIDGADQPSFGPICRLLGGKYIMFDDTFRLNPLATAMVNGMQQNPTSDELTDILVTLGAMFRPGRKRTPLEESVLTSAVRYAFENREGDGARVMLKDLARGLHPQRFQDDPDQRRLAAEFSRVLEETWLGRYGEIMSGTDEMPEHWFIVFDVRSLVEPGKEQLQPVIISLLFRYLERVSRKNISRVGDAKRQILAIIDEAWKAMKNPAMLSQIIAGYRTGRARNLSMHILSQSMDDVSELLSMDSEGNVVGKSEGSPVLDNCAHIFLFAQSDKGAAVAAKTFMLNDTQQDVLAKLGGKAGEYREFVHILKPSSSQPKTFTKLRSRITPEEFWATTTSSGPVGKRVELEALLAQRLATGLVSRAELISELRKASWMIEDGISDEMLRQCVAIHRLAHNKA